MALGALFALSGTVAPIAPAHGSQRHLGGLLTCRLAPNGNGRGVVRLDSFNQSKTHGTRYATRNKRARYIPPISLLTSLFIAPAAGVKNPAFRAGDWWLVPVMRSTSSPRASARAMARFVVAFDWPVEDAVEAANPCCPSPNVPSGFLAGGAS